MDETLYLISCSNHKNPGGGLYRAAGQTLADFISDGDLRNNLYATRKTVSDWILQRRLFDTEKQEGNRADVADNKDLTTGPDLGPQFVSSPSTGQYLPAWARYAGRFFRDFTEANWRDAWRPGCRTLIVSGLYGLLTPTDPIQRYSCHLADRLGDHSRALRDLWRPNLTNAILDVVRTYKIVRIVDLLSEESYQEIINWAALREELGIPCYHRCFTKAAGPESLPMLGSFFRHEILETPREPFVFRHNRPTRRGYFNPDAEEEILFESSPRATEGMAREGVAGAESVLRERLAGSWGRLDKLTRAFLRNAEYVYLRHRDVIDFDFALAAVGLSLAMENWIDDAVIKKLSKLHSPLDEERRTVLEKPRRATHHLTLGEAEFFLRKCLDLARENPNFSRQLERTYPRLTRSAIRRTLELIDSANKKYRVPFVHPTNPMDRATYEKYRDLSAEFFNDTADLLRQGR